MIEISAANLLIAIILSACQSEAQLAITFSPTAIKTTVLTVAYTLAATFAPNFMTTPTNTPMPLPTKTPTAAASVFMDLLDVRSNDGVFRVVPPEGTEFKADNSRLIQLVDGTVMIGEFQVPDGELVEVGKAPEGNEWGVEPGKVVAVVIKDGQMVGVPIKIEFDGSDNTRVFFREDFGRTCWVVVEENTGVVRPDRTENWIVDANCIGVESGEEVLEARKLKYVEKIGDVYNQQFESWEQMTTFLLHTEKGRSMNGNDKMVPAHHIDGKLEKNSIPSKIHRMDAFGLGWVIEDNDLIGEKLVRIDFVNPQDPSPELMSMYVGYIKGGKFVDFVGAFDLSDEDGQVYSGRRVGGDFKKVLDFLTTGTNVSRYSYYAFSTGDSRELIDTNPEALLSQYAMTDHYPNFNPYPLSNLLTSEVGVYYRWLSDERFATVEDGGIFATGLRASEIMTLQHGLNGLNALIGSELTIED